MRRFLDKGTRETKTPKQDLVMRDIAQQDEEDGESFDIKLKPQGNLVKQVAGVEPPEGDETNVSPDLVPALFTFCVLYTA